MKITARKSWVPLLLATTCVALGVAGCPANPDPSPQGAQAPTIPPASTFVMSFGDFAGSPAAKTLPSETQMAQAGTSHENWDWAAGNVGAWNTLITVTLAVPVSAFLESFNHQPTQQPDGSWVWSYSVDVAGVTHTARLKALAVGGDINWDMFISKQGFYTDFHWFSGVSNLVSTAGTWTLNLNPSNPTPAVGIEWHRNPADQTGDIKYTNIVPDGPENGGYIAYGTTTSTPYDAFYDIYNKGRDNLTEIEWARPAGQGRVSDPYHFGDSDWHCWDASHADVTCP